MLRAVEERESELTKERQKERKNGRKRKWLQDSWSIKTSSACVLCAKPTSDGQPEDMKSHTAAKANARNLSRQAISRDPSHFRILSKQCLDSETSVC
jgi:hypothetical protein